MKEAKIAKKIFEQSIKDKILYCDKDECFLPKNYVLSKLIDLSDYNFFSEKISEKIGCHRSFILYKYDIIKNWFSNELWKVKYKNFNIGKVIDCLQEMCSEHLYNFYYSIFMKE